MFTLTATGSPGGVVCTLPVGSFDGFACPLDPTQMLSLRSGGMYFNVHTSQNAAGMCAYVNVFVYVRACVCVCARIMCVPPLPCVTYVVPIVPFCSVVWRPCRSICVRVCLYDRVYLPVAVNAYLHMSVHVIMCIACVRVCVSMCVRVRVSVNLHVAMCVSACDCAPVYVYLCVYVCVFV